MPSVLDTVFAVRKRTLVGGHGVDSFALCLAWAAVPLARDLLERRQRHPFASSLFFLSARTLITAVGIYFLFTLFARYASLSFSSLIDLCLLRIS